MFAACFHLIVIGKSLTHKTPFCKQLSYLGTEVKNYIAVFWIKVCQCKYSYSMQESKTWLTSIKANLEKNSGRYRNT